MPKNSNKTRNFNFRQTKSERSATQSYQKFGAFIKKRITKMTRGKENYGKS